MQDLFISFDEGWGEPYAYFVARMQARGGYGGRTTCHTMALMPDRGKVQTYRHNRCLKTLG